MRIYHSRITRQILSEEDLWDLFLPIKDKMTYTQFKEILGYHELPNIGPEHDAIMEEMNSKALLRLLRGVFQSLNRVKMERDTLQSVIDQIDPMILGEAARKSSSSVNSNEAGRKK